MAGELTDAEIEEQFEMLARGLGSSPLWTTAPGDVVQRVHYIAYEDPRPLQERWKDFVKIRAKRKRDRFIEQNYDPGSMKLLMREWRDKTGTTAGPMGPMKHVKDFLIGKSRRKTRKTRKNRKTRRRK